jgi:hypothetical protein
VRPSRLGLAWRNAVWLGRRPQVKWAQLTFSVGAILVLAG